MVALFHHLFGYQIRSTIRLSSVHLIGIQSVHALAVNRVDVLYFLLEGWNIDKRNDDYGARNLRRIEPSNQSLKSDDRGVFGTVCARYKRKHWPGLGSVDHRHRNVCSRVDARRNLDDARDLFSALRRRCADGK